MEDEWTEQGIVRGLQAGDSNAWAALCSQYSDRLWRYVARLVGSDHAAVADIFQETMLAVARSGRQLAPDSRLWAWLTGIGHRQCAVFWRNRKRDRRTGPEQEQRDLAVTEEDSLLQQETVDAVRVVLSEMPSDYTFVLTAKYTELLSAAEIAESLGESLDAVRSRLARARRDFRERYGILTGETAGQAAE